MQMKFDDLDWKMMNDWQRAMPLISRPFQAIADELEISEDEVCSRLQALLGNGAISRIGATCRPNTLAASTLAAISVPAERLEHVAKIINSQEGVNHSYQREDDWNIWFVATGPTRKFVNQTLQEIEQKTGLRVLDLRLVQPFNVDLGFSLDGTGEMPPPQPIDDAITLKDSDRQIMQALSEGLPPVKKPFAALAEKLGRDETDIIERIKRLAESGVISRIGLIVRHRALGWRSNAMVVFDVPRNEVTEKGQALTKVPGVTLCYERRPAAELWPYTLYCMIHGRSRSEALDVLSLARVRAKLAGYDYKVLFSTRCFKQTGALIDNKRKVEC